MDILADYKNCIKNVKIRKICSNLLNIYIGNYSTFFFQ